MPNCVNNQNLVLVIFHVKFLFFVGFFCCKILIVVNYIRVNQEMTYYLYGKGAKNCNEGPEFWNFTYIFVLCLPPLLWGDKLFLSCPSQFVGTTPLKLMNRISWNLVDSKDTICSCAYYQEILISWILWELCLFELRNFSKFTTEAAC